MTGPRLVIHLATGSRSHRVGANGAVAGINGWVLSATNAGVFPPWPDPSGEHRLALAGPAIITIADEVGNFGSGIASRIVAELTSLAGVAASDGTIRAAIRTAHEELSARPGSAPLGSSVVGLAVLASGRLCCFNVGDSRLYYSNAGSLVRLSRLDRELIPFTDNQYRRTAWIGQPGQPPEVHINLAPPAGHRRVLLCSDGLLAALDEDELQAQVMDLRRGVTGVVHHLMTAVEGDATIVVADIFVDTTPVPPVADDPQPRGRRQRRTRST